MTLELSKCTYAYGRWRKPVLQDFSYVLPAGLTVLLGPNGAGKSTVLRLAASVTLPRTGTVTLEEEPSGTKAFRRAVAWMPQTIAPMPSLTVREYVAYVCWLKGMGKAEAWGKAMQALSRVELTGQANEKTHRVSGGQLRRMGVAAALAHDARILLLDEPTAGMDPHQRRVFRDVLGSLTPEVQVLMSTHDIVDLADEADHITVMSRGRIVHTGSTAAFFSHTPEDAAPERKAEAAYMALLNGDTTA